MDKYIGKKFNRLTCKKFSHKGKYGEKYYLFECECGNEKVMSLLNVTSGKTKSCGCLRKETISKQFKKYNEFEFFEDYVIGYATNTNNPFYIDAEDYEKVKEHCWTEMSNGYMATGNNIALLHRFVTNCPKDKVVDHINHNVKDNRKRNLSVCTQRENALNHKVLPNGITKSIKNNRVYYKVQLLGKHMGCFTNIEDATKRRDEIINEHYMKYRVQR